ncbi:MAG: hypothetical protein WD607_09120 [Candidatus Paceibacterota bacterium]
MTNSRFAFVIIIIFALSFILFYGVKLSVFNNSSTQNGFDLDTVINRVNDTELRLILIVNSICTFSNSPDLVEIINNANELLQKRALSKGIDYSTAGISLDQNAYTGVKFLERFGDFDEISIGLSNSNIALLYNIHFNGLMDTSVPKILIVKRVYNILQFDDEVIHRLGVKNEEILIQFSGMKSIYRWENSDYHIPML